MESNTKTIAKLARVEPRTQMRMAMKIMFSITFTNEQVPGNFIIVLDNISKLWMELIKSRNDNAMEKFYRLRTFQKLRFSVEISKISKFFEKMTISSRETLLLYELFEREPG